MTVEIYYLTYGFKVKLSSYMEMMGYSIDKLTKEIRNLFGECRTDKEILCSWFSYEHMIGGFTGFHKFEIDNVKFIVRSYTHDQEEHGEFLVIGVDVGHIDKFNGSINKTEHCGKENLKTLVKQEKWVKLITESEAYNQTCYNSKMDYGVMHSKFGRAYIEPAIHITTDDCDCCS